MNNIVFLPRINEEKSEKLSKNNTFDVLYKKIYQCYLVLNNHNYLNKI